MNTMSVPVPAPGPVPTQVAAQETIITSVMEGLKPACPVCNQELAVLIDSKLSSMGSIEAAEAPNPARPNVSVTAEPIRCRIISHQCEIEPAPPEE